MEPNNGVKAWQWIVTVVVIIVLIIIGIWVFGGKGTPTTNEGAMTGEENSNVAGALNRVVMSDQYPGNVVYLNSAQFASPGWVVVQADNAGTPGAILGETYFNAGSPLPGSIKLSKSMVDGNTYYAVMYSDDGDKVFDVTKDQPIKDANGNVIMKVFHASSAVSAQIKG